MHRDSAHDVAGANPCLAAGSHRVGLKSMDKLNTYNDPNSQKHITDDLFTETVINTVKTIPFAQRKQPLSYIQTTLRVGTRFVDKFAMLDTGANIDGLLCLETAERLNATIDALETDDVKGVQGATIKMMGTAM